MPNVVRFTLSTARDLNIPGAGRFIAGVLDVDANDPKLLARTRYLVDPYGVTEVGIVDSATPKPSLPAVPVTPPVDPYPQYVTDADLTNPASVPMVALRAAAVAAVEDADEVTPTGAWDFTGATVTGVGADGPSIAPGTTAGQIPVWDGDSYEPQTPAPVTAAEIPFTPVGTVGATTVQAAIAEVAAEATGGGGGGSGVSTVSPMATGLYTTVPHSTRSTAVVNDGRMLFYPLFLPSDAPGVDAMAVEVTAAVAASTVRLGLYERTSSSALTFSLLHDFGAVDASTIGLKAMTGPSVAVAGKRLYLAAVAQGGAPTLRSLANGAAVVPMADPSGTGNPLGLRTDAVSGALPSTVAPGASPISNTIPLIWVRAA